MRKPWVPNSRSVKFPKIWPRIHLFFPKYAPVSTPSSYCIGYRAILTRGPSYYPNCTLCNADYNSSWNESFTCISRKDGNKTKVFPSQGCAAQTATGTLKNGLYLKDKFSLLKICFDLLLVVQVRHGGGLQRVLARQLLPGHQRWWCHLCLFFIHILMRSCHRRLPCHD